jgi:Tat protein translocase TatB subunit
MDGLFGIGFWEILLVLLIILAVMGPRRLPEIASRLGNLYRRFKMASRDLTSELTKEVEGTPLDKKQQGSADILSPLKEAASDLKSSLTKGVDDTTADKEQPPKTPEDNKKTKEQG